MEREISPLYKALPIPPGSRSIRLLTVHPPDVTKPRGGPIRCEVTIEDLGSNPRYAALSYVWGDPSPDPPAISCNGISLDVSLNCFLALLHLREICGRSFVIWVDAISIDQGNAGEKAHQIDLMGDIYSKAEKTYIWLGEGTTQSDRVMKFLSRTGFLEFFFKGNGDLERQDDLLNPRPRAAAFDIILAQFGLKKCVLPLDTKEKHYVVKLLQFIRREPLCTTQELAQFFDCAWINRIWTFQELVLSKEPVVLCGTSQIPWTRLQFSITFLSSIEEANSAYGLNLRRWLNLSRIRSMCHLESQQSRENDPYFHHFCPFYFDIQAQITFLWLWIGLFPATVMITLFIIISTAHLLWVDLYLSIFLGFFALTSLPFLLVLLHHFWQNYLAPGLPLAGWTDNLPAQWKLHDTTRSLEAEIVNVIGTRSATDERDCCYGVHGVLQRFGSNRATPAVDYTLSETKVFQQFSAYLLTMGSPDAVLSLAFQRRRRGAPSWVPDFALNFPLPQEKRREFNVTGESNFHHKLHPDNEDILIVKGYVFDEVRPVDVYTIISRGEFSLNKYEYCHTNAHVLAGDKVALISGISFPVVIRNKGDSFELLGSVEVYQRVLNTSPWQTDERSMAFDLIPMDDSDWKEHVLRKKRAWETVQTGDSISQGPFEDDAMYLDDLAIC